MATVATRAATTWRWINDNPATAILLASFGALLAELAGTFCGDAATLAAGVAALFTTPVLIVSLFVAFGEP